MSTVSRLIFGNWPLKLAALVLATVLYAGLALSESTRSWSGPVPIEVLRAPVGGALLEAPGVVDSIEFRAEQEVADQLTNDSFRASIDLSAVEPRAGAPPVTVPVDVFPVDPRVRVVSYSPPGVTVRLDLVVSRVRPVVIDPGPIPEGIELGPIVADPNQVTIRGASSRVQNVRTVEARFVVDASGINIDQDVALEAFDELGALVPGVEIDPPSVRVRADVARQLAYATVPVVAAAERGAGLRQARRQRLDRAGHRHRQRRERCRAATRGRQHGARRHQRSDRGAGHGRAARAARGDHQPGRHPRSPWW